MRPHLIPASDLAQLLIAAEQAVLAIASRAHPEDPEELVLGLSQVHDESRGFAFAFASNQPKIALSAYRELISATSKRLFLSLPARTLEGLRTLSNFARQHGGHTQFWSSQSEHPLLDLPPDFVIDLPAPEYQRGETTLYGKIERVGGIRPRVRLRISEREVVYGDVTEEQSRELGSLLYSEAALRGQATWDAKDGTVVYFRVEEILRYQRDNATTAFEELQKAADGVFDGVKDVDLFASQIREGDAP